MQDAIGLASDADFPNPVWMDTDCTPPSHLDGITQGAIDMYMLSKRPNGEMGGIGWWQTANGYTAMALHDLWSRTKNNYDVLADAIRKCESRQRGLVNVFNDDTCWWALLCVHMYSIHGDKWFLDVAEGIWRSIRDDSSVCRREEVHFRGEDMEGAVFWKRRKSGNDHINAISTGLYAELGVRLALLYAKEGRQASAQEYVQGARCCLGWILRCRYRPRQGVVLDHLELNNEKAVDWTFTYNTGVTLGTCALLYEATQEPEYMTLACHMAHRSMTRSGWVEDNGVLTEKGAYGRGTHDPFKPNDAVGFKAVLVRQLCTLHDVISRTIDSDPRPLRCQDMIKQFIRINLQSQLERNTNGRNQYGPWWNGPFEYPTSHSQMAALDVLVAAKLVKSD